MVVIINFILESRDQLHIYLHILCQHDLVSSINSLDVSYIFLSSGLPCELFTCTNRAYHEWGSIIITEFVWQIYFVIQMEYLFYLLSIIYTTSSTSLVIKISYCAWVSDNELLRNNSQKMDWIYPFHVCIQVHNKTIDNTQIR